ncbi:hypothetical protein G7054_g11622 [Neopestalotiopsis clavispora]|nr:hypothetical protein G7054_g11622 [Neopestalotiopsis clavispora]
MSSRPSRQRQYLPAVPSPLNPASPPQTPSRQQRRCGRSRASFKKSNGPISPSQRLMRQKAEAAWKSLASKQRTIEVRSATMKTVTRSAKPEIIQIESRRAKFAVADATVKKPSLYIKSYTQQALLVDAFDGGNMGLGIMMEMDVEKQLMASYSDCDTMKASWPPIVLPTFDHHIRGPTIMTQQRILMTLGILCFMGVMSSFFSHDKRF